MEFASSPLMAVCFEGGHNMNESYMNGKIRNWYMRAYPDDEVGAFLNEWATWQDLFDALEMYRNVYDVLGENADSLVRERCFGKLAEIMDVDYDYIYDQWLRAAHW